MIQVVTYVYAHGRLPAFHSFYLCSSLFVSVIYSWPSVGLALPRCPSRGGPTLSFTYFVYSRDLRKFSSRLAASLPFTLHPCSHSTVEDIVRVRVTSMWERVARGINVFFHEVIQLTLHPSDQKCSSCQWAT